MQLSLLTAALALATSSVSAHPLRDQRPSVDDVAVENGPYSVDVAAHKLRNLVYNSNIFTLNTVGSDGYPVGQLEYYADCNLDSGELALIRLNISTAYRNINKEGSLASASIRLGDSTHGGHTPHSPASKPRAVLKGSFSPVLDEEQQTAIEKCFLKQHPDAHSWIPGSGLGFHDADWVLFNISEIYYIGGFGNYAYIGDIPLDTYRAVEPKRIAPMHRGPGSHPPPPPPPPPPPAGHHKPGPISWLKSFFEPGPSSFFPDFEHFEKPFDSDEFPSDKMMGKGERPCHGEAQSRKHHDSDKHSKEQKMSYSEKDEKPYRKHSEEIERPYRKHHSEEGEKPYRKHHSEDDQIYRKHQSEEEETVRYRSKSNKHQVEQVENFEEEERFAVPPPMFLQDAEYSQ